MYVYIYIYIHINRRIVPRRPGLADSRLVSLCAAKPCAGGGSSCFLRRSSKVSPSSRMSSISATPGRQTG